MSRSASTLPGHCWTTLSGGMASASASVRDPVCNPLHASISINQSMLYAINVPSCLNVQQGQHSRAQPCGFASKLLL
jgi:hypothetical protein